jgi:hypothetical protein
MTDRPDHPDFEAYAMGLCTASVCTCLSDEDATGWLNELYPTGITSPWAIAEDATFRTGQPNPCPCERSPDTHRHVLFHC